VRNACDLNSENVALQSSSSTPKAALVGTSVICKPHSKLRRGGSARPLRLLQGTFYFDTASSRLGLRFNLCQGLNNYGPCNLRQKKTPCQLGVAISHCDDDASIGLILSTLSINQFIVVITFHSVMAQSFVWCLTGFFI
jgi:hypothetical protein